MKTGIVLCSHAGLETGRAQGILALGMGKFVCINAIEIIRSEIEYGDYVEMERIFCGFWQWHLRRTSLLCMSLGFT